jgi:hypothetical protein
MHYAALLEWPFGRQKGMNGISETDMLGEGGMEGGCQAFNLVENTQQTIGL